MILETAFVVADRKAWHPRADAWISSSEIQRLRKFRCERISISTLEMKARQLSGDRAEIGIRVSLLNPDANHDKRVDLLFDVVNVDEVVKTFKFDALKVEEGDTVSRTMKLVLPMSALKTEPMTKVRITMAVRDY